MNQRRRKNVFHPYSVYSVHRGDEFAHHVSNDAGQMNKWTLRTTTTTTTTNITKTNKQNKGIQLQSQPLGRGRWLAKE